MPIDPGGEIFEKARNHGWGLGHRARGVRFHRTGKIESLEWTGDHVFFKFPRASRGTGRFRFMRCECKPDARRFDDSTGRGEAYGFLHFGLVRSPSGRFT